MPVNRSSPAVDGKMNLRAARRQNHRHVLNLRNGKLGGNDTFLVGTVPKVEKNAFLTQ